MIQPPIAGADQWLLVMQRADYLCQCVDRCGRKHKDGRCGKSATQREPLVAISFERTWLAACTDPNLVAVCRPCHLGIKRQPSPNQLPEQEGLF